MVRRQNKPAFVTLAHFTTVRPLPKETRGQLESPRQIVRPFGNYIVVGFYQNIMKMDATTEASIEAYEIRPATARNGVIAAITTHETTKRAREEAE